MNRIGKSWIGCLVFSGLNVLIVIGIFTLQSHVPSPINKTGLQYNWRLFENETCFPKKLSYVNDRNVNRSRIALASFPGSGNTWMRHLIQQSTGYYTSSIYYDGSLAYNGFPGESAKIKDVKKQCIVYKIHEANNHTRKPFQKALILIRNPLNTMKAYFNFEYGGYAWRFMKRPYKNWTKYNALKIKSTHARKSSRQKRNTHTGVAPPFVFKSQEFTTFLKIKISGWKWFHTFWLRNYHKESLVVLYEDLKHDLPTELMKIVTFLDVHVDPKDIVCTMKNKEGQFHRKQIKSAEVDMLSVLNEEQIEMIKDAVCWVQNVARELHVDLDIRQYLNDFLVFKNKRDIC